MCEHTLCVRPSRLAEQEVWSDCGVMGRIGPEILPAPRAPLCSSCSTLHKKNQSANFLQPPLQIRISDLFTAQHLLETKWCRSFQRAQRGISLVYVCVCLETEPRNRENQER
ncbi:hypothetical protein QQF64_029428 [Cirrhinus molitorella]|uniref:Uncharacterized protein n=1 Tax=Cirrhinus molitorella TaxID=172907 RepID=A0ABR3N0K3_9TELE